MFCTNCSSEVSEKAIACPKCGVPPKVEKKFCYNCGETTNPNQAMCVKCGVSLSSTTSNGESKGKQKVVAGILALLVGGIGVHKFYHGSWGWGIVYILLFWTYIPMIASVVEGIVYLTMNQTLYDEKYNNSPKTAFKW